MVPRDFNDLLGPTLSSTGAQKEAQHLDKQEEKHSC